MEAEDPVEGGKDGHVEAEPLLATLHLDYAKLLHDDVAGFCSVNSTLGQRAVQRNEYETQSYLEKICIRICTILFNCAPSRDFCRRRDDKRRKSSGELHRSHLFVWLSTPFPW